MNNNFNDYESISSNDNVIKIDIKNNIKTENINNNQITKIDLFNKNYNSKTKLFQMNENTFKDQLYNNKKYLNPDYLIDSDKYKNKFITINKEDNNNLNKRNKNNDPSDIDFKGPWASFYNNTKNDTKEIKQKNIDELYNKKYEIENKINLEKKKKYEIMPDYDSDTENQNVHNVINEYTSKSEFYIKLNKDFKGNSYLYKDKNLYENKNFKKNEIPKKCIYNYKGHNSSISVVKFFPKYGHFILSGSFDKTIKLWETYNRRRLIVNLEGHSESINDLSFFNSGSHFLSSSFDNRVNYWDLEKGTVIKTFKSIKYPYCLKIHPDEDKQNLFLLGCTNHKIYQYDIRTSDKVMVYYEHRGSVNSIEYCDNNRKFISSSDDKKILLWDFTTVAVISQIDDPEIHSVNNLVKHPNTENILGQAYNNKILVFDTSEGNLKLNKKKFFKGHLTTGYSIGFSISKDGNYIASGDFDGKINFWDWKTSKLLKTYKSHSKICSDLEYSPNDKSKLISGSWDNSIKLWGN